MFVPITSTTERLGYYSFNLKEPVIYEAIYQSNKKNPLKYIVRTIKNKKRREFSREKDAVKYLHILLKMMEMKRE